MKTQLTLAAVLAALMGGLIYGVVLFAHEVAQKIPA